MPAVVNPDDITKPTDADAVNYPASMGAAELRALKAKINSVFLNAGVNIDSEFLVTTNNTGIYSKVSGNPSNNSKIMYGFASNVTRTGHDNHTVGGQFSAYLAPGLTLAAGEVFGVVSQAVSNTTSSASLVAAEFAACNFFPNITTQAIWGCNLVFKNRGDGEATPAGGLGANRYNINSKALVITSQPRGAAGEFCGWNTGIYFDQTSMDDSLNGRGFAIDFRDIKYDGGSDPTTAYRCSAVIRMRALQSIILDDSGTDPIRFFFDPFDGKIKFTISGAERWAVHMPTGNVYKNGVLQY